MFFAEKAEEGLRQIDRLFRAVADAETAHARNHLRVMEGIEATKENLEATIDGENHEFSDMYPSFIKQAEGQNKARNTFDIAKKVEQIHHSLFQTALNMLEKGQTMGEKPFYVCQYCGNTVEGEPPEDAPFVGYRPSISPVKV